MLLLFSTVRIINSFVKQTYLCLETGSAILFNAIRFQFSFQDQVNAPEVFEEDLPFQMLMRFSHGTSEVNAHQNVYDPNSVTISDDLPITPDYSTLTIPTYITGQRKGQGNHLHGFVCYDLVRNEIIYKNNSMPTVLSVEIQLLDSAGDEINFNFPFIEIQYEIV